MFNPFNAKIGRKVYEVTPNDYVLYNGSSASFCFGKDSKHYRAGYTSINHVPMSKALFQRWLKEGIITHYQKSPTVEYYRFVKADTSYVEDTKYTLLYAYELTKYRDKYEYEEHSYEAKKGSKTYVVRDYIHATGTSSFPITSLGEVLRKFNKIYIVSDTPIHNAKARLVEHARNELNENLKVIQNGLRLLDNL